MDLYVFCSLELHWIPVKFESTLVFTPDGNQTMELDIELNEEVLKPNFLNSDVYCSCILNLHQR
jgi:hypothetical protein